MRLERNDAMRDMDDEKHGVNHGHRVGVHNVC